MAKPRKTPRCTGTTKKGDQCRSSSIDGTDPPRCRRHVDDDTIVLAKKRALLDAYVLVCNVRDAAAIAGVSRQTHYDWLNSDEAYAVQFADAREDAADTLEREALRRARDGVAEPVFYKGEVVGHVQKYDTTLLIFLLNGMRPEKYRQRHDVKGHVEHEGRVDFTAAGERLLTSLDEYAARGVEEAEAAANAE